jgi:class 3 adenylate cyclase/predicted ATPase
MAIPEVAGVVCPDCGSENAPSRKFCGECGRPLARACPACGAANEPTAKFCGECGTTLAAQASPAAAATAAPQPPAARPIAERRLVSVLFADLVGFTSASESRDAEETRELLSRYFDTARTVIERYGGTVEKFIGDAVMAVWGTPVAQEDDAERAVRAALDLVAAVRALGEEADARGLRLRAGVLTGEAAVTIGAESEGMVAGDLVNTASRVQSAAEPGEVLVGESTRRATEAAIAYEDAGDHELKGKAEPVHLWRARRVTAGRAGALKSVGLETPFVGREREFRLVKDLFHATAEEGRARLVSVIGVAGIGKSRLSWEFFKYIDGLAETVWWHRGRCLAYGEGVAYWALAEMVRMRAGIAEEEGTEVARPKLRDALDLYVPDAGEREWIEPRLAHLLALEEGSAPDREDLFSAWRLFFERLAEQGPCVLVFEDLQWADSGLLDFVEYLLEWSRSHPLFVLTLARPEFDARRSSWGAGKRNFTSVYLEPLSDEAMDALLCGLVPGLPEELRERIRERADGIPLYAVETVRMLLDRGLLERAGDEYRPTGAVQTLEVPETLHALIAARLDGLPPEERRLLESASVLGKSFTRRGLTVLTQTSEDELEPLLASLVRKEVLGLQVDPRSPDRGQYAFLQALMQRVAYETLSRAERKARHLAAADYLSTGWGPEEDEVVEVIASHLVDAYWSAPDAEDAQAIRARAREHLERAGERAGSLGAAAEAQRYFEQAAELAGDDASGAGLLERAGSMAWRAARSEQAIRHLEEALAVFDAAGDTHAAARVSARLGEVMWQAGRLDEALERMERAYATLGEDEHDADAAALAAELGRLHFFAGNPGRARERIEQALDVAESLRLPEVISQALNTKALILRRPEESLALLRHALAVALEHDLVPAAGRAYFNLSFVLALRDRFDESRRVLEDALALARRRGDRGQELMVLAQLSEVLAVLGEWDEGLARMKEIPEDARSQGYLFAGNAHMLAFIRVNRGELEEAEPLVAESAAMASDSQSRIFAALVRAVVGRARGRHREALTAGREAYELAQRNQPGVPVEPLVEAVEAALALDDLEKADELLGPLGALAPVERTHSLQAQEARLRARLAAAREERDGVEPRYKRAAALFRELGTPFWLAVTLLEHGEWLVSSQRGEEAAPLLDEAREIFERLRARPWLERVERAAGTPRAAPELAETA